jgi:2,5-diamino-6-(ribosylamino)-4(3H)-pyrimidinone 5'-phosphate reductase
MGVSIVLTPLIAVDLQQALALLAELGLQSIMVEGGARVISNFLRLRDEEGSPIVDVNIVTVAPTLIGTTGIPATEALERVGVLRLWGGIQRSNPTPSLC